MLPSAEAVSAGSVGPSPWVRPSRMVTTRRISGMMSGRWWVTNDDANTAVGEFAEVLAQFTGGAEIQAGGRLVEDQRLGIVDQRAGDEDASVDLPDPFGR